MIPTSVWVIAVVKEDMRIVEVAGEAGSDREVGYLLCGLWKRTAKRCCISYCSQFMQLTSCSYGTNENIKL